MSFSPRPLPSWCQARASRIAADYTMRGKFRCRAVIDVDGFRPNVGIVLGNAQGQLLWAKRIGMSAWQFPQGGINPGETPELAMVPPLARCPR